MNSYINGVIYIHSLYCGMDAFNSLLIWKLYFAMSPSVFILVIYKMKKKKLKSKRIFIFRK